MPYRRVLTALAALALPLVQLAAQDPVTKPRTEVSAVPTRPPRPSSVTARQLPDGRIEVRWSSVRGADRYEITRSVPGVGAGVVTQPNPSDTVYVDADVTAGRTYYYVVAGVNGAGIGIKQGAPPVTATRAPGAAAAVAAPVSVIASPAAAGMVWLNIPGGLRAGQTVRFERMLADDPRQAWAPSVQRTLSVPGGLNVADDVSSIPAGTRVQWRATITDDATGVRSAPTASNVLTVGASSTTTTTTTTTTSTPAAGASVGDVVVRVTAPYALRVGATAALAPALGGMSAIRWMSLDEAVASVDAGGTATARSAGRAQILAIGRGPDGAVRVTLVHVDVSR